MQKRFKAKEMVIVGLMGALGALLMLFKVQIPFMPPFMSFDLAGLPEIIGGFILGPVPAVFIIIVKLLIKLVTQGSTSMLTGEVQNLILSLAYVLPAVLIYKRRNTKKAAAQGMAVGTVLCAVMAVFTNLYIIIPFYVNLMGMSMDAIVQMCAAVNPMMNNVVGMAIFGIIPFNLIKNGATSIVTFFVYKRISQPVKKLLEEPQGGIENEI